MSMNGHARRTIDTLVALDFHLDEEASTPGHYVYWHSNAPERRVRVFSGISEVAAKKVRNAAGEIAGMSSAGERIPSSVADVARTKRQSEKARREAEARAIEKAREPYQRLADGRRELEQAVMDAMPGVARSTAQRAVNNALSRRAVDPRIDPLKCAVADIRRRGEIRNENEFRSLMMPGYGR